MTAQRRVAVVQLNAQGLGGLRDSSRWAEASIQAATPPRRQRSRRLDSLRQHCYRSQRHLACSCPGEASTRCSIRSMRRNPANQPASPAKREPNSGASPTRAPSSAPPFAEKTASGKVPSQAASLRSDTTELILCLGHPLAGSPSCRALFDLASNDVTVPAVSTARLRNWDGSHIRTKSSVHRPTHDRSKLRSNPRDLGRFPCPRQSRRHRC
jgi:hypothetical protein